MDSPSSLPPDLRDAPSDSECRSGLLPRRLGLAIAVAVVVGNVIGSGIFLKPGTIAAEAGRFDLIISVWIFGGAFCLLGTLCFAELGTMFPEAGGLYAYLRETFGSAVAFLFGWTEFLFSKPAGTAALSVAFTGSLARVLKIMPGPWEQVGMIAALVGAVTCVNIVGVQWGGRLQLAVTLVKAGGVAFIAAIPFLMTSVGVAGVHPENYHTIIPPGQPTLLSQASVALLAVMWAYHGWHGLAPMAEEIRDPQRNIPRAFLYGIGILTLLYVSANVAYHGVLSMSEMANAGQQASEQMLARLMGSFGTNLMASILMVSTFGAINSNLMEAPRVSFAMGRDRVFFRGLGLVHARFGTPAVAIIVTALMTVLAVAAAAAGKELVRGWKPADVPGELASRIVGSLQTNSIFDLLTNFVVFGSTLFFVLGGLAVVVLRFTRPDHPRPYKTWGYPWTPVAFLALNLFFLWQVYESRPLESRLGLLLIVLGLPVYAAFAWRRRAAESQRPNASTA